MNFCDILFLDYHDDGQIILESPNHIFLTSVFVFVFQGVKFYLAQFFFCFVFVFVYVLFFFNGEGEIKTITDLRKLTLVQCWERGSDSSQCPKTECKWGSKPQGERVNAKQCSGSISLVFSDQRQRR